MHGLVAKHSHSKSRMKTTLPQTFFAYTWNYGAVILFPILFVFRPLFKNKGLYVLAPKTLRFCLKFTLWLNCCFAQSCIRLETFPIKLKHPRGLWDQDYKTDQNFTKTSILNWLKDYKKKYILCLCDSFVGPLQSFFSWYSQPSTVKSGLFIV